MSCLPEVNLNYPAKRENEREEMQVIRTSLPVATLFDPCVSHRGQNPPIIHHLHPRRSHRGADLRRGLLPVPHPASGSKAPARETGSAFIANEIEAQEKWGEWEDHPSYAQKRVGPGRKSPSTTWILLPWPLFSPMPCGAKVFLRSSPAFPAAGSCS